MSEKTSHTAGPWSIWTSNSYRRIVSDVTSREVLCGTVQRSDGCADLYFPNGGYEGPDARLICAAPDLLEALRLMVDDDFPGLTLGEQSRRLKLADAAIAKATGA